MQPHSPSLLTPVSSPVTMGPEAMAVQETAPPRRMVSPLMADRAVTIQDDPDYNLDNRLLGSRDFGIFHHQGNPPNTGPIRELLFLPGFRDCRTSVLLPLPTDEASHYDICSICEGMDSIQTILFRSCSISEDTSGFPARNSGSKHKYPLVLGKFPETDLILPITCCDACAFIATQVAELPNGEQVSAALPLESLEDEQNHLQWLATLRSAFDYRFHDRTILFFLLLSLCSTIEDLMENDEPGVYGLIRSLEPCCKSLCRLPGVSTMSGLTPISSPASSVIDELVPL